MIRPLENLDDIRDVAHTVLRKADVAERLPTPVDDIIASCGLLESDDYVSVSYTHLTLPTNREV